MKFIYFQLYRFINYLEYIFQYLYGYNPYISFFEKINSFNPFCKDMYIMSKLIENNNLSLEDKKQYFYLKNRWKKYLHDSPYFIYNSHTKENIKKILENIKDKKYEL